MLAPLASIPAFEARLRRALTEEELPAAEASIDDASTLVRTTSGRTWVDAQGTPDPRVAWIVLASALRGFRNPEGYQSETVGSWTGVQAGRADDLASAVYLTRHERDALRALMGAGGIVSVPVVRPEYLGGGETVYVPVDYGGDPMPFLTEEDA